MRYTTLTLGAMPSKWTVTGRINVTANTNNGLLRLVSGPFLCPHYGQFQIDNNGRPSPFIGREKGRKEPWHDRHDRP